MRQTRTHSFAVREWLRQWPARYQRQVDELAAMVFVVDARVGEAVKWKRLTFTVGDNWHHWVCGIAVTRQGARLVFHKGSLLDDPKHLLSGSGPYAREVSYEVARKDPPAVAALIGSAIAHQTDVDQPN